MPLTAPLFRASEMSTSLADAYTLSPAMGATEARQLLRGLHFDQAPVKSEEGRLLGWVRTAQLGGRGLVESSLIPLDKSLILSRETPVGDALRTACERGLVFLAGGSGISDFVVPSDMDRHVIRCHLYVILSEIEMVLAAQVRHVLAEEDLVEKFDEEQRARYLAATAKGRETHAVEYLYLGDFVPLLSKLEPLTAHVHHPVKQLRRELTLLNELRTFVAHPAKSVTGQFEPDELSRRTSIAERLLDDLVRAAGECAAADR